MGSPTVKNLAQMSGFGDFSTPTFVVNAINKASVYGTDFALISIERSRGNAQLMRRTTDPL
jgi:hypothetical protein